MMRRWIICLFLLLSVSCSEKKHRNPALSQKEVTVLFSPGGLGDNGYNDLILTGLQKLRKERKDLVLRISVPVSEQEAERSFSDWLSSPSRETPSLFVLASSGYEPMAARLLEGKGLEDGKSVLLFETENERKLPVTSFRIALYGVSYLAGLGARQFSHPGRVMALIGDGTDPLLQEAAEGFRDGFAAPDRMDTVHLAKDWRGYMMGDEVYKRMTAWGEEHFFFYPLAGGSNEGVYRYVREYPSGIYTAGMDVDRSGVCHGVVGSVLKHIDRLLEHYLVCWLEEGRFPETELYGLDSGYVDWMVSDDFQSFIGDETEKGRAEALSEEKKYHAE